MAEAPFWLTVDMTFWQAAFLPKWVKSIGHSARVWAAYCLSTSEGKSRLKLFQHYMASWKSITGGCANGTWADQQQGPPYIVFN